MMLAVALLPMIIIGNTSIADIVICMIIMCDTGIAKFAVLLPQMIIFGDTGIPFRWIFIVIDYTGIIYDYHWRYWYRRLLISYFVHIFNYFSIIQLARIVACLKQIL